jgi:hypothetical protein
MDKLPWGSIKLCNGYYDIMVIDEANERVHLKHSFSTIYAAERWFHKHYPTGYIIPDWYVMF